MKLPDAQKKTWWLCSSLFTSMLVFVMVYLSASRTARSERKSVHGRLALAWLGVVRIWNIFRIRVGMHHVVTLLSSLNLIQF